MTSSVSHTVAGSYFVGGGRDVADQCCALPHPLPHPGAVELGSAPEPAEDPAELCFWGAAGRCLPAPHPSRAGLVHTRGIVGRTHKLVGIFFDTSS